MLKNIVKGLKKIKGANYFVSKEMILASNEEVDIAVVTDTGLEEEGLYLIDKKKLDLAVFKGGFKGIELGLREDWRNLFPEVTNRQQLGVIKNIPELMKAYKTTKHAVCKDTINFKASIGCLHFHNQKVFTTDTHRLAMYPFTFPEGLEGETLRYELFDFLEGVKEIPKEMVINKVSINGEEREIVLKFTGYEVRMLHEKFVYPNVDRVIPSKFNTEAVIDYKEFLETLKQAKSYMKAYGKDCKKVELSFRNSKLVLSVEVNPRGNITEEFSELEVGFNGDLLIAFNVNYLLDFLKTLSKKTKEVKAQFINSSYQTLWQSDSSELREIIMPMKTM